MSFKREKCDADIIVDHLKHILHQLGYSFVVCHFCGWIDDDENLMECHKGSETYSCKECQSEANHLKLTLCDDDCNPPFTRKHRR